MSKNFFKSGYVRTKQNDPRVIDTNELVAKRIEELSKRLARKENEGFVAGLTAEEVVVSELLAEEDVVLSEEIENPTGVNRNPVDAERIYAKANEEANAILENARKEAERIKTEASNERVQILEEAKSAGYEEGRKQAEMEYAAKKQELQQKEQQLEAEYQAMVDELEPQFIETITGIYEHIFHVELHSYREILVHLISGTMRKAEGSREFIIHVSKEDYPFVSMQKKQIVAGTSTANGSVEIIEDLMLGKNECMIETEGGIFDCGLGTQLSELSQKLRLLSYEK